MEHFKSTTFFPKSKENSDGMTKQQQCIQSGLPVFAKDILDGGKKTYFSCGYEYFCNVMYKNNNLRHVYELLQYDKPSKIYVDFDCDDVTKKQQFLSEFSNFCSAMVDVIGSNVPIYVLDAGTDTKLSRHVIFELFLENIPQVQNVVEHVLSKCPCAFVDRGVYTRNRVFRILYSYKLGKDPSSALRINDVNSHDYNPEHVFRTLIQAMVPQHYVDGPFSNLDGICKVVKELKLKTDSGQTNRYHGSGYTGGSVNLPPMFVRVIQEYGGVMLSSRENEHFISCVVGGKKCPWSDRPHKNNNQYFTICKANLQGFWQCADPDCEKIQYEKVDWSYLWRKCFI